MSTAETGELVALPTTKELANRDGEWSVAQIIDQKRKVVEIMQSVMIEGEHYGVIPGTPRRKGPRGEDLPPKKTLYKAGAETLCLTFRLNPEYEIIKAIETPDFISFTVRCTLTHINTGNRIASALGSCNSREEKYKRAAAKICPECSKAAIIKGKEEYGGGWLCHKKKDGCGAKFKDGDKNIEGQAVQAVDPSDLHNTILKMSCKRSLVGAVLNGTAASDCFTQDLEDLPPQFQDATPVPTGTNVPPLRKGQTSPGAIPKPPAPIVREAETMDAEYRAVMNGTMPTVGSEEPPAAEFIPGDDANLWVYDYETGERKKEKRPSSVRFKRLQALRSELKIDEPMWQGALKQYRVDTSKLLTALQTEHLIVRLEKWAKTQEEVRGKVSLVKGTFPGATELSYEQQETQNRLAAEPQEGEIR